MNRIAIAPGTLYDPAKTLLLRESPARSALGVGVLALSIVVTPLLARAKRRNAVAIGSRALEVVWPVVALRRWWILRRAQMPT